MVREAGFTAPGIITGEPGFYFSHGKESFVKHPARSRQPHPPDPGRYPEHGSVPVGRPAGDFAQTLTRFIRKVPCRLLDDHRGLDVIENGNCQ